MRPRTPGWSYCVFMVFVAVVRLCADPAFKSGTLALGGSEPAKSPYTWSIADDGTLAIRYDRTPQSADWASVDWTFGPVDLSKAPAIRFSIRVDRTLLMAVRLYDDRGRNLWFERSLHPENGWQIIDLNVESIENRPFVRAQFFFNPAVAREENGIIEIKDVQFGADVNLAPDFAGLTRGLEDIGRLKATLAPFSQSQPPANVAALTAAETRAAQLTKESDRTSVEAAIRALHSAAMALETNGVPERHGLSDPTPTHAAARLRQALAYARGRLCLFGMQDMTTYGIEADGSSWFNRGTGERSDVKTVSGEHAAVLGLDVFNIAENVLPELEQLARDHVAQGGILTLVWHQNNLNGGPCRDFTPVIQDMLPGGKQNERFLRKLERFADWAMRVRLPSGEAAPLLFRPLHEHNGDWFYWGRGHCTDDEYVALWRYTVETLRNRFHLHQLLIVTSPDGNQYDDEKDYLWRYPGDDVVDILGLDYYFGKGDQAEIDKLAERLRHVVRAANAKGKLAALAETGDRYGWDETEMLEIPNWYTRCLLGALTRDDTTRQISYALVWRNGHPRHCFVPYPGHPALPDFLEFCRNPYIARLGKLPLKGQ